MKSYGAGIMIERPAEVALPLEARFMVAGSTWMISSNSDEVLRAAQETFQPARDGAGPPHTPSRRRGWGRPRPTCGLAFTLT
jgi:hypothetical protein